MRQGMKLIAINGDTTVKGDHKEPINTLIVGGTRCGGGCSKKLFACLERLEPNWLADLKSGDEVFITVPETHHHFDQLKSLEEQGLDLSKPFEGTLTVKCEADDAQEMFNVLFSGDLSDLKSVPTFWEVQLKKNDEKLKLPEIWLESKELERKTEEVFHRTRS
eukprot:UN28057